MKRLTSMILLISVFVCMVCTPLVVDAVSISGEVVDVRNHTFGSNVNATSISQWGNYAFVTSGKSLKVLDLQTDSVVMTWDVRAQLSAESGNLTQSYITDDYIVCISNSDILVFENSMRVTDPLNFLMSIKPEGEDSFSQIKKFAVVDDTAYVFYHKDGEVFIAEFSADFDFRNIEDNVVTISSANIHDIGYYEIVWDSIVIDDAVYFVSLDENDIFATLYAHRVNLDTFEQEVTDIITKKESSFSTEFVSSAELDNATLREMQLVVNGTAIEATVYDLYASDAPVLNLATRVENDEYITTFSLTELGESALIDNFGPLETVSIKYFENIYDFALTEIDYSFDYSKGSIALYKSNLIVIPEDPLVHSDVSSVYAYIVNNSKNFGLFGRVLLNSIPPRNTMIRNFVIIGNELVLFYKDSNFIGVSTINPDRVTDIEYTFRDTFDSLTYMTETPFYDFVRIGNRLYYPTNSSTALAYIEIDKYNKGIYYSYDKDNNVLSLYGVTTEDVVTVTVDKKSYDVTVVGGFWRLNISMLKAGKHRVIVKDGSKLESFTFYTEEFDAPIVLSDTIVDENGITVSVKNNTYIYSLNTNNVNLYAVVYDENGSPVYSEATNVTVDNGETVTAQFTTITDDYLASYPGYKIKIYPYGPNRSPISNPYQVDNGMETEVVVQEEIIGRATNIDDIQINLNPVKMIVEVSGVLEATAPKAAWLNTSVGGTTKDISIGYCNEMGEFKAEFDFTNEVISQNGSDYLFSLSAIGMNSQSAATFRLYSADDFNEITEAIVELTDSMELSTVLDDSTPAKTAYREGLGIDFTDDRFTEFDDSVKKTALDKVISKIKKGTVNCETFDEVCFDLDTEIDTEEALELLNTVSVNRFTQVLVKSYKTLEIDKNVWSKYSKYIDTAKALAINEEIIKYRDFEDGDDVEDAIKLGIEDYRKKIQEDKPEKGGGGGGGGGGTVILPPEYIAPEEQVQAPVTTPNTNVSKSGFVDLTGFDWAVSAIDELKEKNIINGMDETHFEPAGIVTRAQFLKMLVLALGLDDEDAVTEFEDVSKSDWFYSYVAAADQIGLAKGDGVSFYPNRTLTREEMAVLAYRALEYSGIEIPENYVAKDFTDGASISDYAKEGITAMQKAGIINGMGDNTFAPKAMCNRAMAAKVISSLLRLE